MRVGLRYSPQGMGRGVMGRRAGGAAWPGPAPEGTRAGTLSGDGRTTLRGKCRAVAGRAGVASRGPREACGHPATPRPWGSRPPHGGYCDLPPVGDARSDFSPIWAAPSGDRRGLGHGNRRGPTQGL